jgi:hypothetical protein
MRMSMSDRRYKMPAETRKFGGKIYHYLQLGTKAEAEKDAERYSEKGYSVRTVKFGRKFAVYTRKW